MKLIKTSNVKEIEWLEKEKCIYIGMENDLKIFEVEEDIIIPDLEHKEIKIEKIEAKDESNQEITPNGKIVKDKKIKKVKIKKEVKKKKK